MYVMEHIASQRDENGGLHGPWVTTLWEMTAKDYRTAPSDTLAYYERVSPEVARNWVRQGGHHNTPLYVDWTDTGRSVIRYARDAS